MKILIKGFITAAIVIFCSLPAATAAGEAGFNRSGDAVTGKYVSYLFDRNTISGFILDISNISGAVASYRQVGIFRGNNSTGVEIHDNRAGTMLINTRQTAGAGAAQNLSNITKYRLKINVSLGGNVTLEKKYAGTLTIRNTYNSTPPGVKFQPDGNVNITENNILADVNNSLRGGK